MTEIVLTALIGGIGTVAGAVLAEVVRIYSTTRSDRSSELSGLKGRWRCQWHTKTSNGNEAVYSEDIVTIERVRGHRFSGSGVDRFGGYLVEGQVSTAHIVTFYTCGTGRNSRLSAVGIMRLEPRREKMAGTWRGYTHQDVIVGGKVIWEEIAAE
jgi:hypothetical protein